MNIRHAGVSAFVAVALLSGCSSMKQVLGEDQSVDYQSGAAPAKAPLNIPPDLTQAADDPRYQIPANGQVSYSQLQAQTQAQQAAQAAQGPDNSRILPTVSGMEIHRDGDLRWLVVDAPAGVVFPKIVDFWTDNGFNLETNDPKAGLLQTNWAENQANAPGGFLKDTIGKYLAGYIVDSGQREQFRTRVERDADGKTEIYITHQQMVQRRMNYNDTNIVWEPGKPDPGLDAAMVARLMVYLGSTVPQAKQALAQAQATSLVPTVQRVVTSNGTSLTIAEPFDRAWRRVSVAMDSAGFSVDDRNRSAGDFYVRYVDTDTGREQKEQSFFSRLFEGEHHSEVPQFRVHLTQGGDTTAVTVLDENGKEDDSATAQRLLSVLSTSMTTL